MARGDVRIAVTLACEECKRRNYQTKKSKRNNPDRIIAAQVLQVVPASYRASRDALGNARWPPIVHAAGKRATPISATTASATMTSSAISARATRRTRSVRLSLP